VREKLVLGLVGDDVNVLDLVFDEDRSAMHDDPEAEFGGERESQLTPIMMTAGEG
jgi:hypothetical protein